MDTTTQKDTDLLKVVFHIKQNGRPVAKEMVLTRANFLAYNGQPHESWAQLYERLVADNAYVSISDQGHNN